MMYCKYIPCVIIISVTPGAGYKASLRVQSERSGGVPPAWADGKIVYNK